MSTNNSKTSQLKLGALLSYVVLALQNLVGLLYTPFMLRMMGKSEYGLYSIAASIVAYLTVLDLGFGNAIVRYTAKYRAEGKVEEQYKMFGMFFLLYCAIGVVALAAGGVLCLNAENIFDTAMTANEMSRTKIILALMVVNLAVTFPFSLFGSIITAYEQFVFQKGIIIVRIVLNTATMIVLLNFGYKAVAMVVVTTLFNIITLGVNFWYCKRVLKIQVKFGKFQWGFLKEVAIYSFWIFLNAIMDRIYWSTGQFVLGAYVGTAAVAVFAVAIQLEHMYMGFSTAISGVFLPKVCAMVVKETDGKAISDLFIKTGRIQYSVMILILSGFFLFGREFIILWAGSGYEDAYIIAMLFFVPLIVPLIQNLGITILQARNQMKFRSLLYLGISLLSLGAQIPLSKYYGGIGCACAIAGALTLGQIVVMNIYYQVKQGINILHFWKEILKMSIAPGALAVACYFVLQNIPLDSVLKLALGILCYLVVYLPLFYVFSMNAYEKELLSKPLKKFKKNSTQAKSILGKGENI
ncbi:MAG: oligosaccharide flippase family protein [Fibrobacter intestinalis]|uniref:oligosaccharide flippase family protein n=1 Tax=Fibrobacter intestinalis TaxID=28122 RepID=UPI003EFDC380